MPDTCTKETHAQKRHMHKRDTRTKEYYRSAPLMFTRRLITVGLRKLGYKLVTITPYFLLCNISQHIIS